MSTNTETPKPTETPKQAAETTKSAAAKAKPAAAAAKRAATKAKPAATAAKPASKATPAKTATKAEPAKKAESTEEKAETTENEKVHVLDKMIDFSYTLTTNIPFGGKYVKKVFDQYETKQRAKEFSHRFFQPFFPFPKVKK